MVTFHIHLVVLVIVLIIFEQSFPVSANRIDDYDSSLSVFQDSQGNIYQRRSSLWSKLFRSNDQEISSNNHKHELHIRNAVVRLIPYKKRTIPLELQKALYAHGIVGRRR